MAQALTLENVLVERDGEFVTITMNRPQRRNALSLAHLRDLIAAFTEVGSSDATGVIVAGNGPVFSAGHDFADVAGASLPEVRSLLALCTDLMQAIQDVPQVVVARVHALLRRSSGREERQETYADGLLTIDFAQRAVTFDNRPVSLTPLEFKLLAAFVRHPRQVLSRDQLLELVWGDAYGVSGDQVKLYVGYLRKKLDPEDPARVPIETVRGFGYRYRPA